MSMVKTIKEEWYHVGKLHGITPRTQRLRKNLVTKSFTKDKFKNPSVRVDPEKLRYYTESWRQNENLPTILKRALAFENVLNKVTIFIKEDELLVGSTVSSITSEEWTRQGARRNHEAFANEISVLALNSVLGGYDLIIRGYANTVPQPGVAALLDGVQVMWIHSLPFLLRQATPRSRPRQPPPPTPWPRSPAPP